MDENTTINLDEITEIVIRVSSQLKEYASNNFLPVVLSKRGSAYVVKYGNIVAKIHSTSTDIIELKSRIDLIGQESICNFFLQPLLRKVEIVKGRLLTLWPAGLTSESASVDRLDWKEHALLLAEFHKASFRIENKEQVLAKAGNEFRLQRMHSRFQASKNCKEKNYVLGAFSTLTFADSKHGQNNACHVIHGDWHPGQVVQYNDNAKLIDIDDVGIGNPAWDLARPAAWYLASFLSDSIWQDFLDSYRDAGGPAIKGKNPWEFLELPARTVVIQSAAKALIDTQTETRLLDDFELELINMCRRIQALHA
ncbi:MAG: phosphotransferase [Oligoflexales bacterium]|nr:phosphotransferase [Oligoflexales bacterium]